MEYPTLFFTEDEPQYGPLYASNLTVEIPEYSDAQLDGIIDFPAPTALVQAFESSVVYVLNYWIEEYGNRGSIQDKLATRVWEALKKEKFEMQFPFPTYSLEESFQPVPARKPGPGNGS